MDLQLLQWTCESFWVAGLISDRVKLVTFIETDMWEKNGINPDYCQNSRKY